jgi:hypothetical protein
VAELRERIVGAGGWRTLQMALACDNPLVQRAALECLSNLVAAEGVVERFTEPEATDLKIFVGFCAAEDEKCQIAASGGLATLAEVPEVSAALIRSKGGLDAFVELAIVAEEPALLHRAAVALKHMVLTQMDLLVGAEGAAPPDHAMPTLGALTVLAKSGVAPVKQAALTAIVELQRRRPDIALPHPDLVAQAGTASPLHLAYTPAATPCISPYLPASSRRWSTTCAPRRRGVLRRPRQRRPPPRRRRRCAASAATSQASRRTMTGRTCRRELSRTSARWCETGLAPSPVPQSAFVFTACFTACTRDLHGCARTG